MDEILTVLPNETEDECLIRIAEAKRDGFLDLYWTDIADFFNKTFRSDETEYRTESSYRKKAKNFLDAKNITVELLDGNNMSNDFLIKKRELEKEKIKIQTEKLEYNRWLREDARDELIAEHIVNAIKNLPPLNIPEMLSADINSEIFKNREACLVISDAHYGVDLKISGLFGEIINEYSPEIFENRMMNLLNQVISICKKENFTTLNVYDLGDEIDGLLRVSQLWKLRYGIIESTVRYGRFITEWLNELSKYVKIKYQMVTDSNHCQLRLLNQPKNTFKDENVSYIIADKIMDRLNDNPNFEFIKNPTGYIFDSLCGYNLLGIHGETKNLNQAIKDFASTYKTQIDILIGGHKHHGMNEQVGINSDIIGVPSIIGVDDYSLSLNKTSNAGATLFIIEQGNGKIIEYNIKL